VTAIEEKKKSYLLKVQETLAFESFDGIQAPTVKEVSEFFNPIQQPVLASSSSFIACR
jgi:hypothetical protein